MRPMIKTLNITLAVVVFTVTAASAAIEDTIPKDLLMKGYAVGNTFALEIEQSVKTDVADYTQENQFRSKKEVVKFVEGRLRRHAWNIYSRFIRAMQKMIKTSYSNHPNAVRPTRTEEKKLVKAVAKKLYDQTKQAIIDEVVTVYSL